MKKALAALMVSAMTCSVLGGCGSAKPAAGTGETKNTTAAGESTAAEGENVTLRFAWWGGDERNAATQEVIRQFMEAHPGVTIEGEPGSSDGYHDKLATQLASGTAPDIVQIDPEKMPTFVASGDYFYDVKELGVDTSLFDANYIGLQINGNYDGKQLGLPTGIAGQAVLVNKKAADKFGVDLEKADLSWGDWIEYGKAIHEKDPESYLFCVNKEYITNIFVLTQCKQINGPLFDANGKLTLTEENLARVFSYVKELYDNNAVPPASYQASYIEDDIQSDANWIAGKYVAAPCYISTIDVMAAGYPDGEYVPGKLPVLEGAKDGGFASNTPQLLSITRSCQHPELAAEFLSYFFNDKKAEETLGATRSVPPTEQARKICTEKGSLTKLVSDAADIAIKVGGTPNDAISSSPEAKTILFDAVEAIGYGEKKPEDAAKEVIAEFSELQK